MSLAPPAAPAWLDARACPSLASFSGAALGSPPRSLSPAWALLLFGDGSPTRALSLAARSPLGVDVLGAAEAAEGDDGAPAGALAGLGAPRVRRRVWLRSARGERLGYAVSWWAARDLAAHLPDARAPIGGALAAARTETARELFLVTRGAGGHAELDAAFAPAARAGAPLWGRWYVMRAGGRALCVVHEVFSPALEAYLGPIEVEVGES